MTKAKAKVPAKSRRAPHRPSTPNPQLDLQTRKLLQKHYRARHGVK